MKNMTLGAFAFACALALASTPGHALSFDFSFSNTVGATVTGEIDGLQDSATGPNELSLPKARQIPGSCGRAAI